MLIAYIGCLTHGKDELSVYFCVLSTDSLCLVVYHVSDGPQVNAAIKSPQLEADQIVSSSGGKKCRGVVHMFGEPISVIKKRKGESLTVDDLKVVVDLMLEGIVRYLRMWGVDVVATPYNDPQLAVSFLSNVHIQR